MNRPERLALEELLADAGWAHELARALVGDPALADDLVQDAWIAALRHPPEAGRPARPWLARVIANLARNRWRSEQRRGRRELAAAREEALPASDEIAAELETQRALVDALAALSDPLRRTVVQRYVHGLSSAEIARREGAHESTIRTRLQRGLEELRVALDRKHGDRKTWIALLAPLAERSATPVALMGGGVLGAGWIALAAGALVLVAIGAWWSATRASSASPRESAVASSLPGEAEARVAASDPGRHTGERVVASTAPPPAGSSAAATKPVTSIEARVVDPEGRPIRGAVLAVVDRNGEAGFDP
jgi:RNA polymerase sigma factor (sigma-70 family)